MLRDTGSVVNGDWAPHWTESTIVGSIQPLNGADRRLLPEGADRSAPLQKLYTIARLQCPGQAGSVAGLATPSGRPDRVRVGEALYEVMLADFAGSPGLAPFAHKTAGMPWQTNKRFKYILIEIRPDANP